MFLSDAIRKYLLLQRDSPRTQETYKTGLGKFAEFMQANTPLGMASVADLHNNSLRDFHLWLTESHYASMSVRTWDAAALAFLRFVIDQEIANLSLEKARLRLRAVTPRESYPIKEIDTAQVRAVFHYWDSIPLPADDGKEKTRAKRLEILRNRAWCAFVYHTGCRLGDALNLDRKQVADGRATEIVVMGKGRKKRYLFPNQIARDAIARYIEARDDAHEPVFISHGRSVAEGNFDDDGKRISVSTAKRIVSDAAHALGFSVSNHAARHNFARCAHEQGAQLEDIQAALGHSSIGTTRTVYVPPTKAGAERVANLVNLQ